MTGEREKVRKKGKVDEERIIHESEEKQQEQQFRNNDLCLSLSMSISFSPPYVN